MNQQRNTLVIYPALVKRQTLIAWCLFTVFYLSFLLLAKAGNVTTKAFDTVSFHKTIRSKKETAAAAEIVTEKESRMAKVNGLPLVRFNKSSVKAPSLGGPGQPEMATFKSIGADNMVSPFTGDFSYNIPLLDVGGYPINIFYNAGITMEQEATWTGLGWNINPGTINRTMRGLPDDFNGEDIVVKEQSVSTDLTVGTDVGAGAEVVGFPFSANLNAGITWNNKRGVGLSLGLNSNFKMSKLMAGANADEMTGKVGVLNISNSLSLSSQDGLSANLGFSASLVDLQSLKNVGAASTSIGYNSMKGLTDLNISGEYVSERYKLMSYHTQGNYSFARSSYTPSIRMPVTSFNATLALKIGAEFGPIHPNISFGGFLSETYIAKKDKVQEKRAFGFMYADKGQGVEHALMDFNRLNDGVYSTKTPAISLPVYTYDMFNITGEGTGGSFRAYRGSVGYVKDARTESKNGSGSVSVEIGLGNTVHTGVQLGGAYSKTTVKEWSQNNALKDNLRFTPSAGSYEGVFFKNPSETAIIDEVFYNNVGKDKLVRPVLNPDGPTINGLTTITGATPTLASKFEVFNDQLVREADLPIQNLQKATGARDKRTQVISYLNAEEATRVGLDKQILAYTENYFSPGSCRNSTYVKALPRYDPLNNGKNIRKSHHISEITVLENDSRRYIYGLPVYTAEQKEVSFSTEAVPDEKQEIIYSPGVDNSIDNKQGTEKFFQRQTIGNFAHGFLLTAILSPDYVDIKGDGVTDDDLGTAVKFNYSCANIKGVNAAGDLQIENYKWRYPVALDAAAPKAAFNEGLKTDKTDNKASYTYGAKELWYMHSLESKNMVATFYVSKRNDGMQAAGENGGVNSNVHQRKLDRIDLYTKADFNKYPGDPGKAKPVKSVHFEYDYSLCGNYAANDGEVVMKNGVNINLRKGKLTLKRIWFTYNGSSRRSGEYVFNYASNKVVVENGTNVTINTNPDYNTAQNDRWGNYKPATGNNPTGVSNVDYPFATQSKDRANAYAATWNLEKILLPSGAMINVNYESDSYGYVQDRRAAIATKILGFGPTETLPSNDDLSKLYYNKSADLNPIIKNDCALWDNRFIYFQADAPITGASATEIDKKIRDKYLAGMDQLLLKLWINVPPDGKGSGTEPVFVYAGIAANGCGIVPGTNNSIFYIHLEETNQGGSPIMQTVVDFTRRSLTSKVYPGYDNGTESGVKQVAKAVYGMADHIAKASIGFEYQLKLYNRCKEVDLAKSFARLAVPSVVKYGGGYRIKSIIITDNWNKISKTGNSEVEKESSYGQEYSYDKKEIIGTDELTITSGVATYEPGVGNEENPFREILKYNIKQPLGPTRYENVELPLAETFFPAPMVGYSRVTIKSIHNKTSKNIKSGVGKQVKEFYTCRDFPVITDFTSFDNHSKKAFQPGPIAQIFQFKNKDLLTLTQGFRVVLNDMNGKPRGDYSYPEGDDITVISSTQYYYRTTKIGENKYRLNNIVPVIESANGVVTNKLIGKDVEVMNDSREHYSFTYAAQVPINADMFTISVVPILLPSLFRSLFKDESLFRSFTTLKVVNEFGILERIENNDKGSIVSTENLVYDAETGATLVTRTNNEFKKPVYNFNYPAHWAETGMAPAYKNIDVTYSNVMFRNGRLEGFTPEQMKIFESGDELFVLDKPNSEGPVAVAGCNGNGVCDRLTPSTENRIWAVDLRKDPNNTVRDFIFIDRNGTPYNGAEVYFRIIRSGHRNLTGASLGSIVCQNNPLVPQPDNSVKLVINNDANVINASAVSLKEKWKGQDMFFTTTAFTDVTRKAPLHDVSYLPTQSYSFTRFEKPGQQISGEHMPNPTYFMTRTDRVRPVVIEWRFSLFHFPHWYPVRVPLPVYRYHQKSWIQYDLQGLDLGATILEAKLSLFGHNDAALSPHESHYYGNYAIIDRRYGYNTTSHNYISPHYRPKRENRFELSSFQYSAWPANNNILWQNLFYLRSPANNSKYTNLLSIPQPMYSAVKYNFAQGPLLNTSPPVNVTAMVKQMVIDKFDPAKNYLTGFRLGYTDDDAPQYESTEETRACFSNDPNFPNQQPKLQVKYYKCSESYGLPGNPATPPEGQETVDCVTRELVTTCHSVFTKQFMNPYIQGILGNWRAWRSYVFYGERKENDLAVNTTDPKNKTDIINNGVLKDFDPYWVVNTTDPVNPKIDPATSNKWIWNSEVLQYNRKGAQLEDHDPLGRYNAAIYGYQETLPIATVSNSRLRQSAFDGFEDYGYKDDPCEPYCKPAKVHFKTNIVESMLEPTESHTGNYSLKVNNNPFAIDIPVSADNTDPVPVVKIDITKTLLNETTVVPAGTGLTSRYYDGDCPDPFTGYHTLSLSPQLYFYYDGNYILGNEKFIFPTGNTTSITTKVSSRYDGKLQVDKTGIYHFNLDAESAGSVFINGVEVVGKHTSGFTACFTPGNHPDGDILLNVGQVYNITAYFSRRNKGDVRGNFVLKWSRPCDNRFMDLVPQKYFYPLNVTPPTPTTGNVTCYQPNQVQVTANATIDGFDLTPTLPGKEMIASIWIKKGGEACNCTSYTGLSLEVKNGSATIGTLLPVSRIIEGWQLFEGKFPVPQNTSLLKFTATPVAGTTFYLDDIRIHPFNANMKSFVFDPQTLRLSSELDENNYASFYEYDDEGTLVRVKKETKDGVKTISETRSAVQGKIKTID